MVYFYHILQTYACQHSLPTGMQNNLFLIDKGILCNCPAFLWSVNEILIALEPYGKFESNFAYIFILILSSPPGMRNGDKSLLSIILVSHGLLVKMLIPLELHGIF